jgi:hypothetical protein
MEKTEEGWVTGAAIDTVLALNELREGDELKVIPLASHDIPEGTYFASVDKTAKLDERCYWKGTYHPPVALIHIPRLVKGPRSHKWLICRENIIAWRRPKTL